MRAFVTGMQGHQISINTCITSLPSVDQGPCLRSSACPRSSNTLCSRPERQFSTFRADGTAQQPPSPPHFSPLKRSLPLHLPPAGPPCGSFGGQRTPWPRTQPGGQCKPLYRHLPPLAPFVSWREFRYSNGTSNGILFKQHLSRSI